MNRIEAEALFPRVSVVAPWLQNIQVVCPESSYSIVAYDPFQQKHIQFVHVKDLDDYLLARKRYELARIVERKRILLDGTKEKIKNVRRTMQTGEYSPVHLSDRDQLKAYNAYSGHLERYRELQALLEDQKLSEDQLLSKIQDKIDQYRDDESHEGYSAFDHWVGSCYSLTGKHSYVKGTLA